MPREIVKEVYVKEDNPEQEKEIKRLRDKNRQIQDQNANMVA